MSVSNGAKELSDPERLNKEVSLPKNITKIEVFAFLDDRSFHSIVFYGDTTVNVGLTPEYDLWQENLRGYRKGTGNTFVVPPGERLLGCEISHD
jgi:hypothetical protein